MTDTTDIKALRRKANNLRTAGQTDAFIDMLLDQLEAEHQRADELQLTVGRLAQESNKLFDDRQRINKSWTEAETDNALLRDELAALKGSVGEAKDWEIDHSTDVPILVYKKCSVIESDQAHGLLNLIKQSELKGDQVPVAWTSQRSLETKNKIVAFTDDMSALDYGTANGWTDIVELFTAPQKPIVLPGINEDLIDILGRPNFTCSGLAEIFRRNGADIKRKSENEQAFVIHWLLGIYLNHGSDWRTTAESEIKELAAKANAGGIVKVGE